MKNPIVLYIPNYYDQAEFNNDCLAFSKNRPLLPEDENKAKLIASIEKVENYQCKITQIGSKYADIATNCFHRNREEQWELPVIVSNCKTYTYAWDDTAFHFRIYWIIISEKYMLQLVGIFEPKYSIFYKNHLMQYFQAIEINTSFDFTTESKAENIFKYKKLAINPSELQNIIDTEKQANEKTRFLEQHMKLSNPDFWTVLETELQEKGEAVITSFICLDWNMYYDLHNPENFSDPDSTIEWENNADIFDYYETPIDNTNITIICSDKNNINLTPLRKFIANKDPLEKNILSFFEHYTFGNGGANAEAIHFQYAKTEIERLHNTRFTNQEFLKRNLRLSDIVLPKEPDKLHLYFDCSWDTEHGYTYTLLI